MRLRTECPGGVLELDLLAEVAGQDGLLALKADAELVLLDYDIELFSAGALWDWDDEGDVSEILFPGVRQGYKRIRENAESWQSSKDIPACSLASRSRSALSKASRSSLDNLSYSSDLDAMEEEKVGVVDRYFLALPLLCRFPRRRWAYGAG